MCFVKRNSLSDKILKYAYYIFLIDSSLQKADYPNGIPECGVDALRFALISYTAQGLARIYCLWSS